jgi:hypothetical protein
MRAVLLQKLVTSLKQPPGFICCVPGPWKAAMRARVVYKYQC